MAEIRLSRIKSSAFKISSYAGPSVYRDHSVRIKNFLNVCIASDKYLIKLRLENICRK